MTTKEMTRSQLASYGHSAVFYDKVTLTEGIDTSDAYIIPVANIFAVGFSTTPNGRVEFTMASVEAIVADTADWSAAMQNSPLNPAVTAWRLVRSNQFDNSGTVIGAVTVKGELI